MAPVLTANKNNTPAARSKTGKPKPSRPGEAGQEFLQLRCGRPKHPAPPGGGAGRSKSSVCGHRLSRSPQDCTGGLGRSALTNRSADPEKGAGLMGLVENAALRELNPRPSFNGPAHLPLSFTHAWSPRQFAVILSMEEQCERGRWRPRPHTAPSSRLSSPKRIQHCQRAFPFPLGFISVPGTCSQFPFCSGKCPKRSSSESRARPPGPPADQSDRKHRRRMQSEGNVRKPVRGTDVQTDACTNSLIPNGPPNTINTKTKHVAFAVTHNSAKQ